MVAWSICADWPWGSAISPTTSPEPFWKPEDSGHDYTLDCDEPYYFGENWSAFQECVGDMDWLSPGKGLVIVVTGAGSVLADAPLAGLRTLVQTFLAAAGIYAKPVTDGEWWDRPAIPFHVVLQVEDGCSRAMDRWRAAGAEGESL
ncbi:barstar family protein [Ammonicoccus fulvus]|uniref:barstar family protein n=1 Tax=Ammonicoccus fulvus TaxID=3138240 RepID=UPI003CC8090B